MNSNKKDVVILFYEDNGGMSQYAKNFAEALRAYGQIGIVGISDFEGLQKNSLIGQFMDQFRLGWRLRRIYNPWRFRRIGRDVWRQYEPDVVHLTSSIPCMGALVTQLQSMGVKVVYTVHDPQPHPQYRTTLWSRVLSFMGERWWIPDVLQRVDALHVHSSMHIETLRSIYPGLSFQSVYVIQHGGGLTPEVQSGNLLPPELLQGTVPEKTLLFFGRIEYYKGIDILFHAMQLVIDSVPDCKLIVAGAGRLPSVPDKISSNLIMINRFIKDAEVKQVFSAAGAIILPYRSATQTGVVPLAAAFSLPAVVTRVGALPELVEDGQTGLVVEVLNPLSLSEAIIKLLKTSGLARDMGTAACRYMCEHYAWSVVAHRHWCGYRRLLSE